MLAANSYRDVKNEILPRSYFLDALAEGIEQARRREQMIGIVLVQIGNLDTIGETFGYRVADEVLEAFVTRLSTTWCDSHTVGLFTNTKVAIVLRQIVGQGQVNLAANKIQRSFHDQVDVGGKAIKLRIAVSGTVLSGPNIGMDRLMRTAERALVQANQRPDGLHIVGETSGSDELDRLTLEAELSTAVDNGELELHYQPKIGLRSGKIVGVESLARWTSDSHGPIRPDIFIDIAERSGLILPLTLLTLNIALRQSAELQDSLGDLTIAVNLSAAILSDPYVNELIKRAVTIWGMDPTRLVLEVTESAVMEEPLAALNTLNLLRETGARVSIDDFGTGYSSLAYLKNLPVNELKIDKSFVMKMVDNDDDAKIVKSVIDLAHNFDLTVVAEGVENEESLDSLTSMGCDVAQGFYLGRPMPFDRLVEWNAQSTWGI